MESPLPEAVRIMQRLEIRNTFEDNPMNLSRRLLIPAIPGLLLVLSITTPAQWDKKPFEEWTDKEAQKVLNESPWGRTQVFTSAAELFKGPAAGRSGAQQPTIVRPPDAVHLTFRIRFLSAKPIRLALSRRNQLKQKSGMSEETAAKWKQFASGEFLELIVIAVDCESEEAGANAQQASSLLRTRGTANLKNNTYLEVKGGKRIFLQEFQPPQNDGFGARFIFPRLIDGKPFITPESEEIHFFTELSETYRLDRRFKTKDMVYQGKLEY